eukprot:358091-Chlamydomonas_euryale.AAC.3
MSRLMVLLGLLAFGAGYAYADYMLMVKLMAVTAPVATAALPNGTQASMTGVLGPEAGVGSGLFAGPRSRRWIGAVSGTRADARPANATKRARLMGLPNP